jgi:hypothetical protein
VVNVKSELEFSFKNCILDKRIFKFSRSIQRDFVLKSGLIILQKSRQKSFAKVTRKAGATVSIKRPIRDGLG